MVPLLRAESLPVMNYGTKHYTQEGLWQEVHLMNVVGRNENKEHETITSLNPIFQYQYKQFEIYINHPSPMVFGVPVNY